MVEILANGRVLVGEEPATAWRRITGSDERVLSVQRLKKNNRTRVYRLAVCGQTHGVIAKRCREDLALREHAVYSQILACAPFRTPRFYGFGVDPFTDDEHTHYWLFIEDLGARRHDPSNDQERRRLARWLGALHAFTTTLSASQFPGVSARRLPYYRTFLDEAVHGLPLLAKRRAFPVSVRALIDGAARAMSQVEALWPCLETLVDSTPAVIAHGDCLPKNIHVAPDEAVIPIDWGSVGVGLPGADLGVSSVWFDKACEVDPCIDAYVAAIRPAWPEANAAVVKRLAYAGRTLWVTKLIAQSLSNFERYYDAAKAETNLHLYTSLLGRSAAAMSP